MKVRFERFYDEDGAEIQLGVTGDGELMVDVDGGFYHTFGSAEGCVKAEIKLVDGRPMVFLAFDVLKMAGVD